MCINKNFFFVNSGHRLVAMASIRVTATSPVADEETHYRGHRDLKELHLLPGNNKDLGELARPCVVMVTKHLISCPVGAEVVSFLPLQVSLYFNVWYIPLWMVASILSLANKVSTN